MKYFTSEEFDCPSEPGSGKNMDPKLMKMIDQVRETYGKPIAITSGWRNKAHNKKVGGKPLSSHIKGLAIDVAVPDSRSKHDLLVIFLAIGFNRIGIGSGFIHVDIDSSKSPNVIWTY
jgi:uncharacterized protein YcbK (DUF882 family)|tara:strand:- start:272 stop:625 length:354 start_codon:yes stop_codon:yes gene_type:complete